ncbi:Protein fam32a [Branchiostoma belcheri]|nr:Protein fam32a [Branchiostoma belcheri]
MFTRIFHSFIERWGGVLSEQTVISYLIEESTKPRTSEDGFPDPGYKRKPSELSRRLTGSLFEHKREIYTITSKEATSEEGVERSKKVDNRTPAQRKFAEVQERRQMERVMNKAALTHKQRVESFNKHLDKLTEHYDIPKVSWTK